MNKAIEPFFSIVTPIYNAEMFLEKSIQSVLEQTYTSWELILVDDCSTDQSFSIAKEFAEKFDNIYTHRLPINSGSAKKPLEWGVTNAKGQFCLKLDADDVINMDYLELMQKKHQETNADILIPEMVMYDINTNNVLGRLPDETIDINEVMDGKKACKATLINWHIGCGGMAFKRNLYDYVIKYVKSNYIHSDEFAEHILLYFAVKVAFTSAEYKYFMHSESITHKRSLKLFDSLYYNQEIVHFFVPNYSDDIDFANKLRKKQVENLIRLTKFYIRDNKHFNEKEQKKIYHILHENYNQIDKIVIRTAIGNLNYFLLGKNFNWFLIICYLLNFKTSTLRLLKIKPIT